MPVFIFLIIIAAALLWLLLSFAYIPLGKLASRLWKDARDAMNEEQEEKE